MTPILVYDAREHRVYIVVRYTHRGNGLIAAESKYDVTDQFESIKLEVECKTNAERLTHSPV